MKNLPLLATLFAIAISGPLFFTAERGDAPHSAGPFSGKKGEGSYRFWIEVMGGPQREYAPTICRIGKEYLVVGWTESFGAGGKDVLAIFIDDWGNPTWWRTFGGAGEEKAYHASPTGDGGFLITGSTSSFGAGSSDILLMKFGAFRELQWALAIGGRDFDVGYGAHETGDGYRVLGQTHSFGYGGKDFLLTILDREGKPVLSKTFGGKRTDIPSSLLRTEDGGAIMAGATSSYGAGSLDVFIMKVDGMGNLKWARTIGGIERDGANWDGIRETKDGGYIISGRTESYGEGGEDILVVKLDPRGRPEWSRMMGTENDEASWSINQTEDGDYIMAGVLHSFRKKTPNRRGERGPRSARGKKKLLPDLLGSREIDIMLGRLDREGRPKWLRSLGGRGRRIEEVEEIIPAKDGYIMAGVSAVLGSGKGDFFIGRINREGVVGNCRYFKDLSLKQSSPSLVVKSPLPGIKAVRPHVARISMETSSPSLKIHRVCYSGIYEP